MWTSYRINEMWKWAFPPLMGSAIGIGAVGLFLWALGGKGTPTGLLLCAYPGNTLRFEYKAIEFESDYRIKMITKEGKTMRIVIPPIATCVAAENVEMSVTPSTPSKAPDISV